MKMSSQTLTVRMSSDSAALEIQDRNLVIATWNVRTLYQVGKLDNVIQEMKKMKIEILGIVETRWTESGKIRKDSHTILCSGGQKHRNRVGILMNCKENHSTTTYYKHMLQPKITMMRT